MTVIAEQLEKFLKTADAATAEQLERTIRAAIEEAQRKTLAKKGWPDGYFEKTLTALEGERFERPDPGTVQIRDEW